jgi:hypothetical protein
VKPSGRPNKGWDAISSDWEVIAEVGKHFPLAWNSRSETICGFDSVENSIS